MQDEQEKPERVGAAEAVEPRPWKERIWRPAGTVVAIGLALLVTWHVVNGQHGLSVWHQMRSEDQGLQKDIRDLEQENQQLHHQIDRLKTNPEAIESVAREKLHYARSNEVIYTLPASEVQGK